MTSELFRSHKTRSDKFGNTELAPGTARRRYPKVQAAYLASRSRVCERFIYLAATPDNRVCKVGMSVNPERRLGELFYGKSHLYASHRGTRRMFRFRLARVWSLGVVTFSEAIRLEAVVHRKLRKVARAPLYHELYRIATSRAVTAVDRRLAALRKAG